MPAGGGGPTSWEGLGRFGPFFAVAAVDGVEDTGWTPLGALSAPEAVRRRSRAVVTALEAGLDEGHRVPPRVAASVSQLGLCARISAVALGAAVDGLPIPAPGRWLVQDRLGGPIPVGVRRPPAGDGGTEARPTWPEALLALVTPIASATIHTMRLSPQVVWGNVASGLVGAARMIGAADRPAGEVAETLVEQALDTPALTRTMTASSAAPRRRRSCCLIYRVAGSTAAVCGDCVLVPR